MDLENFFPEIAIPIIDAPASLEGAEIEYEDADLQLFGTVKNGHLVVSTFDEIPGDTTIRWGTGRWAITW
jgi:hypothetical protein